MKYLEWFHIIYIDYIISLILCNVKLKIIIAESLLFPFRNNIISRDRQLCVLEITDSHRRYRNKFCVTSIFAKL